MSEPAPTDDNDPVALRRGTAARRVYCAVKAEVAKFGLCPWSDAEIGSLVGLTGTDVGAAVGRLRTMGLVHDVLRPAGEDARFGGRTLRAGGKGLTLTPGNGNRRRRCGANPSGGGRAPTMSGGDRRRKTPLPSRDRTDSGECHDRAAQAPQPRRCHFGDSLAHHARKPITFDIFRMSIPNLDSAPTESVVDRLAALFGKRQG